MAAGFQVSFWSETSSIRRLNWGIPKVNETAADEIIMVESNLRRVTMSDSHHPAAMTIASNHQMTH